VQLIASAADCLSSVTLSGRVDGDGLSRTLGDRRAAHQDKRERQHSKFSHNFPQARRHPSAT